MFDIRDGGRDESLQFKTWREIGYSGAEWSLSGFKGSHDEAMVELMREVKRKGKTLVAQSYHNFAVSVLVKI